MTKEGNYEMQNNAKYEKLSFGIFRCIKQQRVYDDDNQL
jgi:hypothetical protein